MPPSVFVFRSLFWLVTATMLLSCGKPPGPEGPPPGMAMPVVVAPVKREPLEERIPMVGSLEPKEDIRVLSETSARIVKISFTPGTPVAPGDVLFELDSRKQKAMLAEGKAKLALTESELARGEELMAKKNIPAQEFDRLKAAKLQAEAQVASLEADLEDTIIRAPFAGSVSDRKVSIGQFVARGEELALLLQTDPLELVFQVPERYVGQISLGQTIRLNIVAYHGETFEGKVGYISPKLDETSRTLLVKVYLSNPEGRLRSGMFGTVDLLYRARENALTVPESAVLLDADRVYVVAVNAEKKAEFRPIKVGERLAGRVEILEGLAEGDLVVVEGYQKLGPGSAIAISADSAVHGVTPEPAPAPDAAPAPAPATEPAAKPAEDPAPTVP